MMHGSMPDYRLAEKMKSRFSGRGAAVSGMQASTTSELMKLAQMGGDPSVNCSELDFRNGARRPRYANNPAYTNAPAGGHAGAGQNSRPAHPQNRGTSAAGGRTGGTVRQESGNSRRVPEGARPQNRVKNANSRGNPPKKPKASAAKPKTKIRTQPVWQADEIAEVKVEGRRMTPMFAVFLVIGTMMIMSIVLSFSEIYQTTSEIAKLENTLAALRDQAAELELKLEERNDIRVIEQIATEELGMVKEDAVQRKYISLSDGERIDIIEDGNAEEASAAPGILLSSIWSSLGNLFDYFR